MRIIKGITIVLITLSLIAGIIICLYIAGTSTLTSKETVFVGILLSSASILSSWIITHLYSKMDLDEIIQRETDRNSQNIRNYAIKAAEKVLNLSNEITRLIDNLNDSLEEANNSHGYKENVLLLQERVYSAIHNLQTLKSMNDTFLSDWRGVIGEEIERQREIEKEIEKLQEQQLNLLDTIESQIVSPDDLNSIQKLISETEKRLEERVKELPFKVTTSRPKPKKQDITIDCPECGASCQTKFRPRNGAKKLIQCSDCNEYSLLIMGEDGITKLARIELYHFAAKCPICSKDFDGDLPDFPSALKLMECPNCEFPLIISRKREGINVKMQKGYRRKISNETLDKIQSKLTKTPWPKGIHKQIAADLGISNSMVTRAINILISEGRIDKGNDSHE